MIRYTCEVCGGSFLSDWTEDDAMEEAEELYGKEVMDKHRDAVVSVCDDCYQEYLKRKASLQ